MRYMVSGMVPTDVPNAWGDRPGEYFFEAPDKEAAWKKIRDEYRRIGNPKLWRVELVAEESPAVPPMKGE